MTSTFLTRRLLADTETPLTAYQKLTGDAPHSFLYESVEGGVTLGRYSVIGTAPDLIWRCVNGAVEINRNALNGGAFEISADDPLQSLKDLIRESQIPDIDPALPPMAAGVFGYMGFSMMRFAEPVLKHLRVRQDLPEAVMMRPSMIAIFDNVARTILLAAPVWSNGDATLAEQRLNDAEARLKNNAHRVEALTLQNNAPDIALNSNISRDDYAAMINKGIEYIKAGDIFQIVLSQRFTTQYKASPFTLYRHLRRLNPSPFLVYMNMGGFHIVASSPEILVRVRDGEVTIRPIAGTRPRGRDEAEDLALETELLADEKELAEHLMLLDLGRNDVGRVAEPRSVKVTEKMIIEKYSHVMHIVSNVTGKLDAKYEAIDAVMAGFPHGTISGAPKIRAVELINELEKDPRGLYGGCMGYFGANGDADTCLALRTGLVKDGILEVQAAGGIVADSKIDDEFNETVNKAKALLRAAAETI